MCSIVLYCYLILIVIELIKMDIVQNNADKALGCIVIFDSGDDISHYILFTLSSLSEVF